MNVRARGSPSTRPMASSPGPAPESATISAWIRRSSGSPSCWDAVIGSATLVLIAYGVLAYVGRSKASPAGRRPAP